MAQFPRQLREDFAARPARAISLSFKSMKAGIDRLTRPTKAFSNFVGSGSAGKKSLLFLRPRSAQPAVICQLSYSGRGGMGRRVASGMRLGRSTRGVAGERLGSGNLLWRTIHAAKRA